MLCHKANVIHYAARIGEHVGIDALNNIFSGAESGIDVSLAERFGFSGNPELF